MQNCKRDVMCLSKEGQVVHYSVLFKTGSTLRKNFRTFVPGASSYTKNFEVAFPPWAQDKGTLKSVFLLNLI